MSNQSTCLLRIHTNLAGAAYFDFYRAKSAGALYLRIFNASGMIPGDSAPNDVAFQMTATMMVEQPCGAPTPIPVHPIFEWDPGTLSGQQDAPDPTWKVTKNCTSIGPFVPESDCVKFGWTAPMELLYPPQLGVDVSIHVLVTNVAAGAIVKVQDLVQTGESSMPTHLRVQVQSPSQPGAVGVEWQQTPLTLAVQSQNIPFAIKWMEAVAVDCASPLIAIGSLASPLDFVPVGVVGLLKVFAECPLALINTTSSKVHAKASPLLLPGSFTGSCCQIVDWSQFIWEWWKAAGGAKPDKSAPLTLSLDALPCLCPAPTPLGVPPPPSLPPLDLMSVVAGPVPCCKVADWFGVIP